MINNEVVTLIMNSKILLYDGMRECSSDFCIIFRATSLTIRRTENPDRNPDKLLKSPKSLKDRKCKDRGNTSYQGMGHGDLL